jgi:hypothetical protein
VYNSDLKSIVDSLTGVNGLYGNNPPYFFDFHVSSASDLLALDSYLAADGLTQSIVIGETTPYDNVADGVALATAALQIKNSRTVWSLTQWPMDANPPAGCVASDVAPPYAYDQFIAAGW